MKIYYVLCPRIPRNESLSRWKKIERIDRKIEKRKQIEHKELINVREES